jgi:hypothetical protein
VRPVHPTAPPPRFERPRLATIGWALALVVVVCGCLLALQPVGFPRRWFLHFYIGTFAAAFVAAKHAARRIGRDEAPPRGAGSAAHAIRAAMAVILIGFGGLAVWSGPGVERTWRDEWHVHMRTNLGLPPIDVPPSPARAQLGWLWIGGGVLLGAFTLVPSWRSAV